ncbi:MAG: ATP-binding protein [Candidatus Wallbacteria bacterium]|nr:ATP-binding protein [Candidatus Wallbacteria bacterium]
MLSELLLILTVHKLPVALEKVLERVKTEFSLTNISLYYLDSKNYQLWQSSRPMEEKAGVSAGWPGIPLFYHQALIGRLVLEGARPDFKLPEDIQNLITFMFYQEVSESSARFQLSRLNTLYEISRNANNLVDLSGGISTLIEVVSKFIYFDIGLLYLWNDSENLLQLHKSHGTNLEKIKIEQNIKPGVGPLGEVAENRKPLLFYDEKVKSYLAMPIESGDKLLGILAIGTYRSYAYNEQDIISLKILSSQLAGVQQLLNSIVLVKSRADGILESMPAGLLTIDTDYRINSFNSAAATFFPNLSSQLIGQDFKALGDSPVLNLLEDTLKSSKFTQNFEIAQGNSFFEASSFPFKNEKGELLGAAVTLSDKSEIKNLKHELEIKARLSLIGEMAASLAHEIRNPLSGIRMLVQVLKQDLGNQPERNEFIEVILGEVDRLDSIVSGILEYTRPSAFKQSRFLLMDLLNTVCLLLKPFLEKYGVAVEINVGTLELDADFNKLKQVFLNLLKNGVQAMAGKATRLSINGERKNGLVIISVSDYGEGINQENLKRIFTPFFTTRESGSGLGLALVKRIVEEHSGKIEVDSVPDSGTTFRIILPEKERR